MTDIRISGHGKKLTIYIGESDRHGHRPLYQAILETLKREGLAGATVTRGLAGFGAHSRIHTAMLLQLSEDLPLIIEVVDTPEKIERGLVVIGPMIKEGLITLHDVEIVKYTHRALPDLPGDRPVRDIMTPDPLSVRPDTPAAEIVELLLNQSFKAVPVIDAIRHVIGIISDGDLMERAGMPLRLGVGQVLDEATLREHLASIRATGKRAADIMTPSPICLNARTPVDRAARRMVQANLKRAPVVDEQGRLVGMLSRVDLLRTLVNVPPGTEQPAQGTGTTVGEMMDERVPTVPEDAPIETLVERMVEGGLRRVIVVDAEGRAAGIITDGDLVARVTPPERPGVIAALLGRGRSRAAGGQIARAIMSPGVLSGPPDTPIASAVSQMIERRTKRFVVVDAAGRPIGIADRQMLLRGLLRS
jgi:CBS domain-containing protein